MTQTIYPKIIFNTKFTVLSCEFKKYFPDDKEPRSVFTCEITHNKETYTFTYGQSIANKNKEPNKKDVMGCFQYCEPGTFEDFCDDFGYDNDSIKHKEVYHAVCTEWLALNRLFTTKELEELQEYFSNC